jgi:hypothetical protein
LGFKTDKQRRWFFANLGEYLAGMIFGSAAPLSVSGKMASQMLKEAEGGIKLSDSKSNVQGNCSRYARNFGKGLFGKDYKGADAWDFASANAGKMDRVPYVKGETGLKTGDILGIYYPGSAYNEEGRDYTHLAYVVISSDGIAVIYHNFHGPRADSLEEFLEREGCKVIEIIRDREGFIDDFDEEDEEEEDEDW